MNDELKACPCCGNQMIFLYKTKWFTQPYIYHTYCKECDIYFGINPVGKIQFEVNLTSF